MKQETTKDRVKVLLEELQITQKAFEDAVGLANGWCNKVGFNIREDVLRRISKAYPELNLDWLRFGQGSMWKEKILVYQHRKLRASHQARRLQREVLGQPSPICLWFLYLRKVGLLMTLMHLFARQNAK